MVIRWIMLVLLPACAAVAALQEFQVPASAKKIQMDGFLFEWKKVDAQGFAGCKDVAWDAAATSEGLAGYVCGTAMNDSCAIRTLILVSRPMLPGRAVRIEMAARDTAYTAFYRKDVPAEDSGRTVVAEYVVPWDSVARDSAGRFRAGLLGVTRCGDTLGPALLVGTRTLVPGASGSGVIFTPMVRFQIVFVAVLLAVYIGLLLTVRKKKHPRKSLRR